MLDLHRPTVDARPMARRPGVRSGVRGHRAGIILGVALLAVVALIGATQPSSAIGVAPLSTSAATVSSAAAAASAGSPWDTGSGVGLSPLDLITKGAVVLFLLFITLRVLGRMQGGAPKRDGRLVVIESRTLAPKASLHLVAVGGRRLVVGLTPSGMVSLAELDASEFKETEAEAEAALQAATGTAIGSTRSSVAHSFPATALAAVLVPIDAVTDRLATFFSRGRVR